MREREKGEWKIKGKEGEGDIRACTRALLERIILFAPASERGMEKRERKERACTRALKKSINLQGLH